MAFNPLHTFQRNKRFWMAAILMICMISFVFCTGMKGDMSDRIVAWFSPRGSAAFTINGRTYTSQQVGELRSQRNLANKLLLNCADMTFKKLSKELFELGKKQEADKGQGKEADERQKRIMQIQSIRQVIAFRKSKQRYFDGGVKFDDLVEFAMWQAMADKLAIQLDDEHTKFLYFMEFFFQLSPEEVSIAERDVLARDFRDGSLAVIRRALTEEFRVRIAQEALVTAQPFQFFGRRRQEGLGLKFTNPDVPDETRAPLTFAQLWDDFKRTRAEFDVTMLPLEVDKFLSQVKAEPTEAEKKAYFDANKDKTADPSADVRGLQRPTSVKIEYLMADATTPAYLNAAKKSQMLSVASPWASEAVTSPLAAATGYWALNELHRKELEEQYASLGRNERFSTYTSPYNQRDCTTPILAWLARQNPQAGANLVGHAFLTPTDGFGAMAGYLAWGATKHPAELEGALRAELKRRAPIDATVFSASTAQSPFNLLAPFLFMDMTKTPYEDAPWLPFRPKLPVEAVAHEIDEMLAQHSAEAKAQENMQIIRAALEKDDGSAEKFKRDLKKYVTELHLTYGPENKSVYVNRYTVNDAKELAPLKEAYLKSIDMINLFEGRDVTPERLLKPGDFQKMFFDSTEIFAATAPYRAMPWPPNVKPNNARIWKPADPRLINYANVNPEAKASFDKQLGENNPLQPQPVFTGLFDTAAKPILFWRTAERIPQRPSQYADIARDIEAKQADLKTVAEHIKKQAALMPKIDALRKQIKENPKEAERYKNELKPLRASMDKLELEAGGNLAYLERKQSDFKEDQADLKEVQRLIVEGWKFEKARSAEALPTAKAIAEMLIKNGNQGANAEAAKLHVTPFSLSRLCQMYPEESPDRSIDYGKPPLPKDKLLFPRADLIDQAIGLYDLDKSIKIGDDKIYAAKPGIKELDDINAQLFEQRKNMGNARGNYVQILTNKPRSVFYVAFVGAPPEAKKEDFILSLRRAPQDLDPLERMQNAQRGIFPDHWVERVQQQDARTYRANVVEFYKTSLGYTLDNQKAKSDFDGTASD